MLQTTANITACDKHIQIVTNLYKYWQTYTNCDKHIQIVTNTKKDRKQKNNNGDRRALKKCDLSTVVGKHKIKLRPG